MPNEIPVVPAVTNTPALTGLQPETSRTIPVKTETGPTAPVVSSTPDKPVTTPAKDDDVSGQAGQEKDWQVKYTTLEKSYGELRKKLQEQGTERNQYRQQMETLQKQQVQILETLRKATEAKHDPDQFMEDFRTQGPKFLEDYFGNKAKELQSKYDSELATRDDQYRNLELRYEIQERKLDPVKYPDFAKLEAEMTQAYLNGGLPFATGNEVPVGELIDSLYNFVKLQHSQDALKVAEENGKKKAEEELAREANSGVAGGGKRAGTAIPDLSKMSTADARKWAVGQFGEVQE